MTTVARQFKALDLALEHLVLDSMARWDQVRGVLYQLENDADVCFVFQRRGAPRLLEAEETVYRFELIRASRAAGRLMSTAAFFKRWFGLDVRHPSWTPTHALALARARALQAAALALHAQVEAGTHPASSGLQLAVRTNHSHQSASVCSQAGVTNAPGVPSASVMPPVPTTNGRHTIMTSAYHRAPIMMSALGIHPLNRAGRLDDPSDSVMPFHLRSVVSREGAGGVQPAVSHRAAAGGLQPAASHRAAAPRAEPLAPHETWVRCPQERWRDAPSCFLEEYPGYVSTSVLMYTWAENWLINDISKCHRRLADAMVCLGVNNGGDARRELIRRDWNEARFAQALQEVASKPRNLSTRFDCDSTAWPESGRDRPAFGWSIHRTSTD